MSTAYAHGCLNTHHFNLDPLPTRLHITRTQNQLSFDCSAFEVKWYIELRLKWTLNLSISYLGDHCLSVRASSPLKLGSRKWWTALVWKNNPCWHFVSRSRIRHVEHMSAYPLLLSDPVLCNLVVFFFSRCEQGDDVSLFELPTIELSRARNPLPVAVLSSPSLLLTFHQNPTDIVPGVSVPACGRTRWSLMKSNTAVNNHIKRYSETLCLSLVVWWMLND